MRSQSLDPHLSLPPPSWNCPHHSVFLTEVQQCCISHERSYQNSCTTAQLFVQKLLGVWLYFTKTVRLKAYTLIKLFVAGGCCATYAFTSIYYAYIVFMLDNSSPIKTVNLSSHFKGFYPPSKKNPASHVLQRFGRDILFKTSVSSIYGFIVTYYKSEVYRFIRSIR